MKPRSSLSTPGVQLALVLCLGALGQWFLSRREEPWTLWVGFAFYLPALFLWLRSLKSPSPKGPSPLSTRVEGFLFALILLVAAFYRLYRLEDLPPGVFLDEASSGWGALKILHEGWRPLYEVYQLGVWDPTLYYLLALWFKFFTVDKTHFFLFSAILSLLSFPFLYWTFRQLAGTRAALFALFVLAVMRWDIIYSRDCHPAIQLPFYMFGTLGFWLYGRQKGKTWALVLAGLFFAGGFYIYQAYKAFILLMALFACYEWSQAKREDRWKNLLAFFVPGLLFSSPIWGYWLTHRSLGSREAELFIFPGILKTGGLGALFQHFLGTALMFNREGDSWFLHNLPYHRMLDDVTGSLWVLGFFLALTRIRERKYFYPTAGLLIMSLPAALSIAATHGSRAFGTVPFLALLAGSALSALQDQVNGSTTWGRKVFPLALTLGLALMAYQNFRTYFQEQMGSYDCWRGPATDATVVGTRIAKEGNATDFYLSPPFYKNYTVLFLGYFQNDRMHELDLPQNLTLPNLPPKRGVLFALDEARSGELHLLQDLYPGGETETVRDPWGNAFVHFYKLSPVLVEQGRIKAKLFLGSHSSLRGSYFAFLYPKEAPTLVRMDPLINFTFHNDFPLSLSPPFSVLWRGTLTVTEPGSYRFLALTTDQAALQLDGKTLFDRGNNESGEVFLGRGPHSLRLLFQKPSGVDTALTLAWKKPGALKYEVVPYSVLTH